MNPLSLRWREGVPMNTQRPDTEWFLDLVAGAAAAREARELAEAEHAARSAGCVFGWDPTWTCELLPGHDPEGQIDARESVDLDAHPAADPRARDIERVLLASADLGSPEMARGFYIAWRLEPTFRLRGPDGGLLIETNDLAARDADDARHGGAEIIRDHLETGALTLPGHQGSAAGGDIPACPETGPGNPA